MKKVTIVAATVLLLTLIADLFVKQYVIFGPEDFPGYYMLYALAGIGIILLAGWLLPIVLRRKPADD